MGGVGYGKLTRFEINSSRDTLDVIHGFLDAGLAIDAMHPADAEGLLIKHGGELLLFKAEAAASATPALAPEMLHRPNDTEREHKKHGTDYDHIRHTIDSFLIRKKDVYRKVHIL